MLTTCRQGGARVAARGAPGSQPGSSPGGRQGHRQGRSTVPVQQGKEAKVELNVDDTVQYQESEADWTPRREEKNIHEKNPASKSLSCSSSSRSSSSLKAQQALSQRKPKKAKRKESSQGRRRESAKHGTCARTWLRRANRRRTCPWGKCWMSQGGFKNARAVDRNGWGPLLYSTPRL